MKNVLIYAPMAHPGYLYLSVPLLVGQLENSGIDAHGIDMNIKYFNHAFTSSYLEQVFEKIKNYKKNSSEYAEESYYNEKIKHIKEYLEKHTNRAEYAIKYIESAVKILKTNDFYNPKLYMKSYRIIMYALELISCLYYPQAVSYTEFHNEFYKQSYKDIKSETENKDINPFLEYFEQITDSIITKETEFIGISASFDRQIMPALTLAKILKKKTKAHISLGGNVFCRIEETLKQNPEIFDIFADSIMVGDGEKNIIKLVDAVNNRKPLDNISGIIYKKDGDLKYNSFDYIKNMQEIKPISLTGYNLKDYFIPEVVLPIQISKGCYWGKCTFCDYFHGKPKFFTKTVSQTVKEMSEYKEKYGISNFEFVDEAISPHFYDKFADKLLEENLDIHFHSMARLEKEFTLELLQKIHKAGLSIISWGYESASKRIMELINKGVDLDFREEIIKNSAKTGIWNFGYIMLGFPSETKEEAQKTISFIEENQDIIDNFTCSVFKLRKHSPIAQNPEKFNLKNRKNDNDFAIEYSFEDNDKTERNKNILLEYFKPEHINNILDNFTFYLSENYLILYLVKYGREYVKNIKISSL